MKAFRSAVFAGLTFLLVAPFAAAAPSSFGGTGVGRLDAPAELIPDRSSNRYPPKPAGPPVRPGNPLWAVPLSTLTATRERPLFTPSRRAPRPAAVNVPVARPAPPPAPAPALPEHPNLSLVGTVAGESEAVAVFVDSATREVVRLRQGEGHGGWILQSVQGRGVMLQKGNQTENLALPRPAE